ncbi:MAG: hypothetical protein IMY72_02020 [Bacteroidetes bacterium]|nr:hypothetical protein [Bacteroidota bacterium]
MGKIEMNMQGINFDIGLPLKESTDFDTLYVDWLPEQTLKLNSWLKDEKGQPVAVTGQIGCGKTTFIRKAFLKTQTSPDISLNLNDISIVSQGSFYGLFLGELLPFAQNMNIDLESYSLDVLFDNETKSLKDFIELLKPNINLKILKRQEQQLEKIDKDVKLIKRVISNICELIEIRLDRKLFIYADGVDKFNNNSAGYLMLSDLLDFLADFKTLYETNIVHVFCNDEWRNQSEQIILTTTDKAKVLREILKKRLGIYATDFEKQIPKLYKLSGGNFRQALRILVAYEFALRKLEKNKSQALDYARKIVRQDLLSTINLDFTLLKVINKDGFVLDSTIRNEKSANNAIYGNQIFLNSEKDDKNRWYATINPLLLETINLRTEPVSKINIDDEYYKLAKFQLKNIFNSLASYFLSKGKNEINVIVHDDISTAHIVNDYLVGRAGAYEEILYDDIEISNNNIKSLIYNNSKSYDGLSCFFIESITAENLSILEINRNRLIEKNMLWWISKTEINACIKEWQHLRQFMHFFDLEKDILSNIQAEDIEEDIEDLELLDYSKEESDQIKERLMRVLNYVNTHTDVR